jgi:hypothetical protein
MSINDMSRRIQLNYQRAVRYKIYFRSFRLGNESDKEIFEYFFSPFFSLDANFYN